MGRRSRGDGSVFYDASRPRGRWVGQIDLGRDPVTGKRRRPKVSAPTKTECKDKLDELRGEKRKTGTVAPRDVTVEAVMLDYLANPPGSWQADSTIQVNTDHANRVIRGLGKVRAATLTAGHVEGFLRGLAAAGLSSSTLGSTKRILSRALDRAVRDGLAGRNVAALAVCPRGTKRVNRAMTLEQVGKLLGAELSAWWRAYIVTGIMCGLRPGELLGLRWEDVDFDAGVIRVRKTVKAVTGAGGRRHLAVLDLKTERSRRTLAMPLAVRSVLAAVRREQAAARLASRRPYEDHGLVFAAKSGLPRWPQGVRKAFAKITVAAGLGEGWHPHEMRHSFVSVLSDAGIDIDKIADAAGHINSNVTKTVYRHVIADKITEAATVMDSIFPEGKAGGS
jgi:integrase